VKTAYIVAISVVVSVTAVLGTMYFTGNEIIEIPQSGVSEEYFEEYQQWARNEIDKYTKFGISLQNEIEILKQDLLENEKKYAMLRNDYKSLRNQYALQSLEMKATKSASDEYVQEIQDSYPKTTLDEQTVTWEFYDSLDNFYVWTLPIESYESYIRATEPRDIVRLQMYTGETVTVRDHTKFVRESFKDVIEEVYDNAGGDEEFIYGVWYIVSQLTTYSTDIGEDPRWAVETFTRGGGDCEDLAILIADMIKSSKHSKNWDIQFVYFDSDNPSRAKDVNHVAITIDTGSVFHYIEPTAKTLDELNYWNQIGITGWYFDV